MLSRRFTALEHPTPESIDCNDLKAFASTVLWLEDQKIRQYKIEDREILRKVDNLETWKKGYDQYKKDLQMPKFNKPIEEMTWLTSLAIRYEYMDDVDKYKSITAKDVLEKNSKPNQPSIQAENLFDNIDFNHPDFVAGVRSIAEQLGITHHPNHLIQLNAAAKIIKERIGKSSTSFEIIKGKPFPFEKGNDIMCDDPDLDYPIRILRLIQIHKLRDLQTKINETIVAVQDLTADPKTDTKLGKVGF